MTGVQTCALPISHTHTHTHTHSTPHLIPAEKVDLSALEGQGGESLMLSIALLAMQGVRSAYGILYAAITRLVIKGNK